MAPQVYVIGRQTIDWCEVERFLKDRGTTWKHNDQDTADPEFIVEMAGRVCYMAFGPAQYRVGAKEYIANILSQGHGSVLEHAHWVLLISGVSRSLTHELVRHRSGVGFSQLSQRYVDESDTRFVLPPAIKVGSREFIHWNAVVRELREDYSQLVDKLLPVGDRKVRDKRIKAREAARSVLPNATETIIVMSANARALRWILSMRGSSYAEAEIRRLQLALLPIMQKEAPHLFGDLRVHDGCVFADNWKV